MNITTRTFASLAIASAPFFAWAQPAAASAEPVPTISLTDVHDIDTLPVCEVEDCSDQPGQVGVWLSSEGDWYLERGEDYTRLIVDNTVMLPGTAA